MHSVPPFHIFFADSNSSVVISQMTTLKLPINNGFVIIKNVAYSNKVSGTVLTVGRLCTAGVVPVFDYLALSLFVSSFLVTTTFKNNCWWLDVFPGEWTKRSATETPSYTCGIEMNLISQPTTMSLSLHEWHKRLGHVCNKTIISFLKQHVPEFDPRCWQLFYCKVCVTSKSTHQLSRARTNILKNNPLDLLTSDIMGPFAGDVQGFRYLLTVCDHTSTYSVVYPLKSCSDAPNAILDAIKQFQVCLQLTPKVLQMDNAREFTSSSFVLSLAKLGVSFFPLLPYLPQENGEAEHLNQTLGDMAWLMMVQSQIPEHFWGFACASECFMHNCLRNS
ncbi:hypothetical protein O181_082922 [Austropuccinia psidii MF-1]|uniref:Integrase catalytic domain-containing protein n=1 Tax=Austropuccinia psidii MF-1 TaxID=1389203 RepID=A0A9Q3IJN1_9BASI|nr:hypothetical protein [Austropuccinia psidii MF-1]